MLAFSPKKRVQHMKRQTQAQPSTTVNYAGSWPAAFFTPLHASRCPRLAALWHSREQYLPGHAASAELTSRRYSRSVGISARRTWLSCSRCTSADLCRCQRPLADLCTCAPRSYLTFHARMPQASCARALLHCSCTQQCISFRHAAGNVPHMQHTPYIIGDQPYLVSEQQRWPCFLSAVRLPFSQQACRSACMCMQVYETARGPPVPSHCERGCAPRVPAPRHRLRVLQPQRLQVAGRGTVCIGQRLGLQARQGGHELCSLGWRAGSAHISRQACQDLLQLAQI